MHPRIFLPLAVGGVLCLCGTAQAQQQESRIGKILKADSNQSFNLMQEKTGSSGIKSFTGKMDQNIGLKESAIPRKFDAKAFLAGKSFDTKSAYWAGDFKYSISDKSASSRFLYIFPVKNYNNTKVVPVKGVTGSEKRYEAASVPTRDFRGKEASKLNVLLTPEQAAKNGYQGDLTEMKTIEDVRALLNKDK